MGKNKKHNYTPQPKVEIETVDAIVNGVNSMLNIRSTPEVKDDNVITTLENGSKLKVEEPEKEQNGFYKIIIFDKEKKQKKGYAMKKYIKIV